MNALSDRVVTNQRVLQRNQQLLFMNHPLLADLNQLYSRHAFETMLHQYMLSHEVAGLWPRGPADEARSRREQLQQDLEQAT